MAALKSSLPCYAAIPILEMYAETTIGQVNKKMCAPMFITPLFITERKTSRKINYSVMFTYYVPLDNPIHAGGP